MSTVFREQGIETLHDQIVSLIAQRWAKALQCSVSINTKVERNPWAKSEQCTDVVGWRLSPEGNNMHRDWIAEVETADSLLDHNIKSKWKKSTELGVPFYLLVPKGFRGQAMKQASAAEVSFNGVYEYCFINEVIQFF
ncbi:MAG: hypothetical protein ACT4OO_05865 [Nitrospiraceae bacterium]